MSKKNNIDAMVIPAPSVPGVPEDVLAQPIEQRLAYFNAKVIQHPRLMEADQALMNAICHPGDATLVLVFGPTGVGKSTLRKKVEARLVELLMPELLSDPERIPYASVEAVSPERGYFNWKLYYRQALVATMDVGESMQDSKRRLSTPPAPDDAHARVMRAVQQKAFFSKNMPADDLRLTLEDSLRHRRPKAFFIDEGQHLSNNLGGRFFMNQMENLKSLASTTHTLHVLVGTYGLLHLINLSAQLARRSIHIHFPRYGFDQAEDALAFKRVLVSFQAHLPVREPPDLVANYDYLYEGCAGCVGTLKGWLYRALAYTLEAGERTVTRKRLEQCADVQKALEAAVEIHEGEETVTSTPAHQQRLRVLLGMPTETRGTVPASPGEGVVGDGQTPKRKRKRAVRRLPTRDPIGRVS